MITTAITESVGSDLKACVLNLGAQATDKTPPLTSVPGRRFVCVHSLSFFCPDFHSGHLVFRR